MERATSIGSTSFCVCLQHKQDYLLKELSGIILLFMTVVESSYQISCSLGKYCAYPVINCKGCNVGAQVSVIYGDIRPFNFSIHFLHRGEEKDFEMNDWTYSYIINGYSNGNDFNPHSTYDINCKSPSDDDIVFSFSCKCTSIENIIAHILNKMLYISLFKSKDDYDLVEDLKKYVETSDIESANRGLSKLIMVEKMIKEYHANGVQTPQLDSSIRIIANDALRDILETISKHKINF